MSWSLDWFAAERLARQGAQIRRVAWTDRYLVMQAGFLVIVDDGVTRTIRATDFGSAEFYARDWTDQPFDANPCTAVPAYNTTPIIYGRWTAEPIHPSPPPPGFPG